jgi:hypothetical protein
VEPAAGDVPTDPLAGAATPAADATAAGPTSASVIPATLETAAVDVQVPLLPATEPVLVLTDQPSVINQQVPQPAALPNGVVAAASVTPASAACLFNYTETDIRPIRVM